MLKKRKAKLSSRGIYLQDRELMETAFQVGTNYKYAIDIKAKKIIILPSDNLSDNTVSKRKFKNFQKPVIDIRKKDALQAFSDVDYLQVSIYGDQIVVEGFNDSFTAPKQVGGQVKDITELLSVKRKKKVVISKQQLARVVGEFQSYKQISLFDSLDLEQQETTNSRETVISISDALQNIGIPLSVISLFSGAGMFDKSFKDMGFEIVYAMDYDAGAAETYAHNLGDHIEVADINKVDLKSLPKAPVMIAGPSCKGHSKKNRINGGEENKENKLLLKYIESIQYNSECKVFVIENVPELMTSKYHDVIYRELSDFEITHGILHADKFGSGSKRKRVFYIGSKIGRIELPVPDIIKPKTIAECFKGLNDDIPNQQDYSKPRPETVERMKHVPPGGNFRNIPEEIRPNVSHSNAYRRLKYDEVSVTLANIRKECLTHPEYNRGLTVREAARIMDMPDSFVFKGTLSSRQQQIGNGIPLLLGKAIATVVKNAITKFNIRFNNHFRTEPSGQLSFI